MTTIQELNRALPLLTAKDQTFAQSLMRAAKQYGTLTTKQLYWVERLIASTKEAVEEPVLGAVGNFAGVYALFAKAKVALRFPKIKLQVSQDQPVALSIAGAQSKCPGVINVTDGAPFGMNKWYGRVEPDGTWTPGRGDYPELPEVATLLKRLAEEPEATASAYGSLTGYCCFRSRPLKDEKSTAAGYGPSCAKAWGLSEQWKAAKPTLKTL